MKSRWKGVSRTWLLMGLCLFGAGCASATGGAEAGNPSRSVVGSVPSSGAAALAISSIPGCAADQVIAVDSKNKSYNIGVAEDCSFELLLPVPEAYRLDFLASGQTAASMAFNNSPKRFLAPVMDLSPGADLIHLDQISIKSGIATPSQEPSMQNDQNGNGIPDFSDPDADSDGIMNENEPDCDLDGIIDDFDEDTSTCLPGSKAETVLEVSPRNGEGFDEHGAKVKPGDEIDVRFSCLLDGTGLQDVNLDISSPSGLDRDFHCILALTGSGKQVQCTHPDFAANTIYQAQLASARCDDGTEIPAVTWSWKTQ